MGKPKKPGIKVGLSFFKGRPKKSGPNWPDSISLMDHLTRPKTGLILLGWPDNSVKKKNACHV